MKQAMQRLLDGRNLDRALAGIDRIEEWLKKNEKALEEILVEENWDNNFSGSPEREISPEPPSAPFPLPCLSKIQVNLLRRSATRCLDFFPALRRRGAVTAPGKFPW